MINLTCEPELVAKCIIGRELYETVKNAVVLSTTSKVMQTYINSIEFFEAYAYLRGIGHFLSEINQTLSSFKDRCFELRSFCENKNETFSGAMFGDALVDENGVEVVSFDNEIRSFRLAENSAFNNIVIPEDMLVEPRGEWRSSPFVARSKKYLAINKKFDSCVYIFTPKGETYLSKFQVEGEISQIAIVDDRLYVVQTGKINAFNLDGKEESLYPVSIPIGDFSMPICFGKDYLIFSKYGYSAIPLTCFETGSSEYLELGEPKNNVYLFSLGNDFIEVEFRENLVCDITKISIEDSHPSKIMVKKRVDLSPTPPGRRMDVCFKDDRLLVAYEYVKDTKIISYDLLTGKIARFSFPGAGGASFFKPRFLSVAENIYYLMMNSFNQVIQSNLSTFTFRKI